MDPTRFDSISKLFASQRTRRSALATGVGLAATAIGGRVLAQEGTPQVATPAIDPTDPHPSADDAQPDPEFLFVQPFDGGTWAPKDGEDDVYTLTLSGAAANTVYFSDRPERVVGLYPTEGFLNGLGFTPENPPNAALVAQTDDGETDILVIELLNPAFDADAETLAYDARVLADYGEPGLAHLARQQQDYELAESFGSGSLFIDDCPNATGTCYQVINGDSVAVGRIGYGQCTHFGSVPLCGICGDGTDPHYGKTCADAYPDTCHFDNGAYDCFVSVDSVGPPPP